jgi:hypothetical protein
MWGGNLKSSIASVVMIENSQQDLEDLHMYHLEKWEILKMN